MWSRGGSSATVGVPAGLRSLLPKGGALPDDVWRSRHRGVLTLLWLHLPLLVLFAVARGNSVLHGLAEAGAVAIPAAAAQLSGDRRRESTIFAALGLMTASAVLVHLSGGVIEAHFHFFVMVGVVVLYQDWRPFLVAIGFVVLHHGVMGVLFPQDVYNHQSAWENPWTWAAIHGLFILGMSVSGIASWRLSERSQAQVAWLAAIVESSEDAIYGWTTDGTITSWNRGAAQLHGYSREEILGRSLAVLVPADRADEVERQVEMVRRGERVEAFESERLKKDGGIVPVSVTTFAVRSPEGDVIGGATIASDITERRRAGEAVRLSEERTRRIIDTARDAFVGVDSSGLITDWNRSAELAFGWSRQQALGRPLAETILPERYRGEGDAGFRRLLAADKELVRDGRIEASGLHRDGHEFPIEVAIWRVADGAGEHFSAFIQDITERKRAEQELQQTLSLLGATLESTADGILVVDPDGRISSFNSKFAEMWRLPQSVLASRDGKVALDFVVDQLRDPQSFLGKVEELLSRPDAESHDSLLFKDGREFERFSKPQRVGGAIVGRVWSFHDVTERKRLEAELAEARDKALETSRLKSEFLATMSHEIRTPMNGVIGLTGLLLDTSLTEVQRQYADGVRASGEALLGIINDILDFSKIEAGKLELETVDFELESALDEVMALVAEPARVKGLELVTYCMPEVPQMLRGDVGRLRQVLLNLVSNAVKFTDSGEVVVRASVGAAPSADQVLVHLEVSDTGIGIAPHTAARLFEPFSQADASTTRRYGGTGLGLAICRRLVEAMGGNIGVRSELGEGSTFWLDVPFGRNLRPVRTSDALGHPLEGLRALVVDDNRTNRLVLASQLLAWNITADLAADAYEALEHLRQADADSRPYDLALVDLAMPGMDGLELARVVSTDPELAPVRLLLLSSVAVEAEVAAEAGFLARLTKPVRLSLLYDTLVRTVGRQARTVAVGISEGPTPLAGSRGRLLIVEDNAINQAVAKGLAARLGYRCDVAGNGIEALAALGRRHYDAVLMDCQMPEMDGFEATAHIRRREAGHDPVPIIAMTAGALVEDRERCLAAGMDDYLAKPVNGAELERVLNQWVASGGGGRDAGARPLPLGDAGNGAEVLDPRRLHELRTLDPDGSNGLVRSLFEIFLAEAAAGLSAMASALQAVDDPDAARRAHSLRGAARNMGATEVAGLSGQMEDAVRAGRREEAAAVLRALRSALDRVRDAAGSSAAS